MKRPRITALLLACCLLGLPAAARSQDAETPPVPAMREVSPGIFEIGQIRLDQKARTVSFPAKINKAAKEDVLEYLLVTTDGATHESLLTTLIRPTDLNFALLLLGVKGPVAKPPKDAVPAGPIDDEFLKTAPKPTGDPLTITAHWKDADGAEKTAPVDHWLVNAETQAPVASGPWLYTGSMFSEGKFLAQQEGCFAALVINPSAMINNPRTGNDNDSLWAVNTKTVPPLDTAVTLSITVPAPAETTTDQ
jgi:hypothetical protein